MSLTNERRKFLASISEEERIIRKQIRDYKYAICNCKDELSERPKSIWLRVELREYKVVLKNLKKQLPAPRKEYQNEYLDYCLCPICRWYANHERGYCPKCGQKLR